MSQNEAASKPTIAEQIKALVFISAFAPESGESAADLSGKFHDSNTGANPRAARAPS